MAQSKTSSDRSTTTVPSLNVTMDGTTYNEAEQTKRLRERNAGSPSGRATCVDCGRTEPRYGNNDKFKIEKHHLIKRGDWQTEAESHPLTNLVYLCTTCHATRWEDVHPHIQLRAFQSVIGGMLNFQHEGTYWPAAYLEALHTPTPTCASCFESAETVKYDVFPGSSDLSYTGLNVFPYHPTHARPTSETDDIGELFGVENPDSTTESINDPSKMTVLCDCCYYGENAPFTSVRSPDQGGVERVAPHLL